MCVWDRLVIYCAVGIMIAATKAKPMQTKATRGPKKLKTPIDEKMQTTSDGDAEREEEEEEDEQEREVNESETHSKTDVSAMEVQAEEEKQEEKENDDDLHLTPVVEC